MRFWDQYGLKKASEVKSKIRFGIYGPNYLCYHVFELFWTFWNKWQKERTRFGPNRVAADMEEMEHLIFWWFLRISEANTASKRPPRFDLTSDLKSVILITYICILILIQYLEHYLTALEATTASKQPLRSNMISDLKSVTSITHISMCILLTWFGPLLRPFWWPQRPLQPPNGLGGQIWFQIWNLWPQLLMQQCLFGQFRHVLALFLNFVRRRWKTTCRY